MGKEPCSSPGGEGRPRLEVADIFRAFGDGYCESHVLTAEQRSAVRAITSCRTAVLGGHLDVCSACGHEVPAYNSCRNRHCPKCQSLAQAAWLEARQERILPTRYFHVVFTLPHEIKSLVRFNQRLLYDLLLETASRTLLEFGHSRLEAQIGITTVLHTWTRDLRFHPHAHCVVTAGGLALDQSQWVSARSRYLFPVTAMSTVFRGKFLAGVQQAYDDGHLEFGGACADLAKREAFARWMVLYSGSPARSSTQRIGHRCSSSGRTPEPPAWPPRWWTAFAFRRGADLLRARGRGHPRRIAAWSGTPSPLQPGLCWQSLRRCCLRRRRARSERA